MEGSTHKIQLAYKEELCASVSGFMIWTKRKLHPASRIPKKIMMMIKRSTLGAGGQGEGAHDAEYIFEGLAEASFLIPSVE